MSTNLLHRNQNANESLQEVKHIMQDYIGFAEKNGVALLNEGPCQFCGAMTIRGVHECLEIFNLGFQEIDFSQNINHLYRFLIVDAHALQHPEIHGRWSNHFHLSRLHLIFKYNAEWTYADSPRLSDFLNSYKLHRSKEYLKPPEPLQRGLLTTTDIRRSTRNEAECKQLIIKWASEVYEKWSSSVEVIDEIAKGYLNRN